MRTIFKLFFLCSGILLFGSCHADTSEKDAVLEMIHRANNYWQSNNPAEIKQFWNNGAYHTGNMEAYFITGEEKYRAYSEAWAEFNDWKGARSDDKSKWKYHYGESEEFVLFGDQQTCFQTYIDLYNLNPEERKIARVKEVMEYQMSTPNNNYWWWSDGLYMVMPVMTKMYKVTKNQQYLDKLYEYTLFADSIMFDSEANLYYRDAKYVYPKHKSANGGKDFWARGDGWVFAGLAKVLQDLPQSDAHYAFFKDKFQRMAVAIAGCQQPEGYWTRSMLDRDFAPGPETSGTAFFIYGFEWGVNNGFLDKKTCSQTIENGWKYLSEVALQEDGLVGYVQPIGEKAIPGQVLDARSTANFGVGAFLLAASEQVRYLDKK